MSYGFEKAVALFKDSAKRVDAYKKFLKSYKINPHAVKNEADFKNVPITDKKSYLLNSSLKDIFPDGKIAPMVYASSGSSGKATFWYRGDQQEETGADIHSEILSNTFGINKKSSTLVVVCFSMGVWVAGNYTAEVFRRLSRRGFNITTVTPGIEKEDIFNIVTNLAPQFENVILAGYPPFLMDVVLELKKRKAKFTSKFFGLTAGDKFNEEWRSEFLKQINSKNLNHVCAIYGCADAGVLGYETKTSIFIRRLALKNKALYKELFGEEKVMPALVQYNPKNIFFEEVGGELVFTAPTAAPLIRYNIHDIGKVYSAEQFKQLIKKLDLGKEIKKNKIDLNLPVIVKTGRTDVAVTFYALNIYPEHILKGLDHPKVQKHLTGNFLAYTHTSNGQKNQHLRVDVEVANGIKLDKALLENVKNSLIESLLNNNIEYRKLRSVIGSKADPVVKFYEYQKTMDLNVGSRMLLNIKGKKPKMVLGKV